MSDIKKYCYDGTKKFCIEKFDTNDVNGFVDREEAVSEFVNNLKEIHRLQQKLYADRDEGVIFIFQAMDAAGKDGVIRTVFSTLSPHGVKEYCFKAPSQEELSHDFLWRFWSAQPAKGSISIFNRSYYEDVLVGKVHKLYKNQHLPERLSHDNVIEKRYESIIDYEKYLYNTGTRIIKIFLNVSKDEQGKRFISRIDSKKKNWKISPNDIEERKYWDEYMDAFEKMINITSTKESPWYVVPSDHKWYSRLIVSRIVLKTLEDMKPKWPEYEDDGKLTMLRQEIYDSLEDKDLKMEEFEKVFSTPSIIVQDMFAKEEKSKIHQKKLKLINKSFQLLNKLKEDNYIINDSNDIVNIIVNNIYEIDEL